MKKLALTLLLLSVASGLAGISAGGGGSGTPLPDMTGNAGEFLNTDGTIAQWLAVPGGGDMLAANNLSDVVNKSTGRTNLGVAIGTNVQAFDADLTSFASITPSANMLTFLGAANYAAMKTQLSLTIGTDVQAWDADLDSIAALTLTDTIYYRISANTWAPVNIGTNLTFSGGTLSAAANLAGSSISFSDDNFGSTNIQSAIIELNATNGLGPNAANAKVDWSQIGNMPTGFADGMDDASFTDPEGNYTATTIEGAIVELNSVDGSGPNSSTSKVDWSQLGNVPADFADGSDDGGGVGGADADAIHDNVSGEISALTEKALPIGADLAIIEDSTASNSKKKMQLANMETLLEAVMDLNQMQGSVTDSQVPDNITVNTALTGDSATAFFTSGQIERARGGTGADTSAFGDGLIGSNSSNVTVDIDTVSELETALGATNLIQSTELDTLEEVNALVADGDFVPSTRSITISGTSSEITSSAGTQDFSGDRTWTLSLPATIDLGGKTSLELPNSAAPSVTIFGQIAGDNNLWAASRGAPVFFDGTASVALIGALVSDTPTTGQVPVWNTGGTITWETFTATPGGSDTQLQYNDGGVLNGTTGLTWNDATNTLSIATLSTTDLNVGSLRILDNVDQSHALVIVANENLASDVSLQLDLNGATRTFEVAGNTVISGTNTGDQTITLTGEVTGTGTGSFATTIADTVSVSNWTLTTPTIAGVVTFPDDFLQTFNPGTTNAGLNVGSIAGDPSTPTNGSMWYDSTANELTARINGANVALGAGGGGGAPADATYLVTAANGTLSAEEVVGTTPGGELGGTWASPTIDDTITVTGWTMGASAATTPAANDNDTSLATTAYMQTELTAYASDTVTFTNKTLTAPTLTSPIITGLINLPNAATDATLAAAGDAAINTTDEQISFHSAADGEISGEVAISALERFSITFDPKAVCDGAVDRLFLFRVGDEAPEGIVIDEWHISFSQDPATELDADLKRATAPIGVGSAAVIDALDTTTGAATEDTDANINAGAVIANGQWIYIEFITPYTATGEQIVFNMVYHSEED